MVKITEIKYSATVPTYEYANHTIELKAVVAEDEDPEVALTLLQKKVHFRLKSREDVERWEEDYRKAKYAMEKMSKYYSEAKIEYERLVTFCKAAGIKKDFAEFPDLPHVQNPIAGYLAAAQIPTLVVDNQEQEVEEPEYYYDNDNNDV
ncbi:hypothetical protein [Gloeothece verrucosa]|uniref:Uncharacterized protein n=1 Tax=Gloeothece verrucosa (strain PCC 7822) TaxID=497965 RepID=E0U8Q6_GLOV7|nr:hypothetical protein [Gloeothece verrucosa]ADN14920.1 hypothetical protein Cyan7822_2963 [Gloeothece verrucosa PCC 7822]